MAIKAWYCVGDLETCLGECFVSSDLTSGPFGDTDENLAHALAEVNNSTTELRIHTGDPIKTWMVGITPDFIPVEVV